MWGQTLLPLPCHPARLPPYDAAVEEDSPFRGCRMSKALQLGIAGLGTVGGGVLDILGRHGGLVAALAEKLADALLKPGAALQHIAFPQNEDPPSGSLERRHIGCIPLHVAGELW